MTIINSGIGIQKLRCQLKKLSKSASSWISLAKFNLQDIKMKIEANNVRINYEIEGPKDAPVLMFSHSLAANLRMWDPQVQQLKGRYRLLRYDMRGHGKSEAPRGAYSFEQLAIDAVSVMDALGIASVHWVGLSMGGMIGMELGIHHPHRVETLTLANTKAFSPPGYSQERDERIEIVKKEGMEPLVEQIIGRWFTDEFVFANPGVIDSVKKMIRTTPSVGMIGACHALNALDYKDHLSAIKTPTLIIAGEKDESTTVEDAQFLHHQIRGSRLAVLRECKHFSNMEKPEKFNASLERILPMI
jgi:3-oxoadipate enol-lactonase